MRTVFLLSAACALAAPALAQTTMPAPSTPTPQHEAESAATAPTTAAANASVAGQEQARQTAVQAVNIDAQAQYAADMAAYEAKLRADRREALRDEVRWHRQQRAYADAMAAWRIQVAECNRGNTRACNAPSPDPAAFY